MKKLFFIINTIFFQFIIGQHTNKNVTHFYENNKVEKVYLHLNNVLYEPEEVVHYKIYVTNADNSPSNWSDYVYVEIFDASNKKIETQNYLVQNGSALGSFTLKKEIPAGIYKIKAYTKWQNIVSDVAFETSFFVQKISSPRLLMSLEFKKKGYGKGATCEADFELKNIENQPIKNYRFKYEIFIAGKKVTILSGQTNAEGKALLVFDLPEQLTSTDGIINLLVDYDNYQESITRSIPINLNFVDLQFLPESGQFVVNETCTVFFIAKNEFGLPLDVSGTIVNQDDEVVANFSSFHDGMGKFKMNAKQGQTYFAKITSPFVAEKIIKLPEAVNNAFVINALENNPIVYKIFSPQDSDGKILIRNTDKIHQTIQLNLDKGWNEVAINPKNLPVGIQNISLVIKDKIVAEKLAFFNYQNGLNIDIKTDKLSYLPREKVKVTINTTDSDKKAIPSNLSVSVVDNKLVTYMNDKQHTILSWMFLGFELKGKIHEPSFYFDEKIALDKRLLSIDLLLNTHGWRKYNQEDIIDLKYPQTQLKPERNNDIEGFLSDENNKPVVAKILLFTDDEKVYETKSDAKGYFKFTKTYFAKFAYLVIKNNRKKDIKITNSIANYKDYIKIYDSIANNKYGLLLLPNKIRKDEITEQTESEIKQGKSISLKNDLNSLKECVVVAYGIERRANATASVSIVATNDIENSAQALSGKIAGLEVQSANGQSGTAGKILIRGNSSLYGNRSGSQPLIVIDGVPFSSNENANILGSLSPSQINNITVLKDASASAIYGVSGVNGVIIITTKNGNFNMVKGVNIGRKSNYTIEPINKFNTKVLNVPENFYVPIYESIETNLKTDFRNCIYWNGIVQTNKEGIATFEYYNSDDNTSFKILTEGISYNGDVGKNELVYSVSEAFQTDLKIPLYTTMGDSVVIPLRVKNNTDKELNLTATLLLPSQIEAINTVFNFTFEPNESKVCYFPIHAIQIGNKLPFSVVLQGNNYSNTIEHEIDIYASGFPINVDISGTKTNQEMFQVSHAIPNTIQSGFKILFNPFTAITDGLQSMLREPSGCFEQVSSSNYPNIMALQLLSQINMPNETFKEKALRYLTIGYQKMKNYESKDGGFDWYGSNPGNEALTAYGLLQFNEMKDFITIDKNLVERSIKWLYSRKDYQGGFKLNHGKYGFSNGKYEINNAYITYVLSEIGEKGNDLENDAVYTEAIKSKDTYRMVLSALTSFNTGNKMKYYELNEMCRKKINEFGYKGLTAENSIVRSYGGSLNIEIASLYALSLLKEKKITKEIDEVMSFIQSSKTSHGFGSTQATALALKAITQYTIITKTNKIDGNVVLKINNKVLDATTKDKDGNINLVNIKSIHEGNNNLSINIANNENIPYLFYLQYQTNLPPSSKYCLLDLKTQLLQSKINLGQTTRLEITIKNKGNEIISNPIARIGIPGGTTIEPWQLKELIEKEIVDYYEIFGNELVLYFRNLDRQEIRKINLDLKAIIPGSYTGVASSAYLYYNNQHKNWNKGIFVEIEK